MKKSKIKNWKIGFGAVSVLCVFVYAWLYLRFPIYSERTVTNTIEQNIPVGTSQVQVVKFLNTLKKQDVYFEAGKSGVGAYFPETMFYMRGWRCVAASFTFKHGKMSSYEVKRVSI